MARGGNWAAGWLAGALVPLAAGPAVAHAFGARYDLPVPLSIYLTGAGAAVFLSFVVMMIFDRRAPGLRGYPSIDLLATAPGRRLAHPAFLLALRIFSVAIFALVLATGLLGTSHTIENFAPTLVWVLWWVGMAYISALLGDLWAVVNPWNALFGWLEALFRRLDPEAGISLDRPCPAWLGVWPAVVLFWLYAWLELISDVGERPSQLAGLIIVYSAIVWAGMAVFGREEWLKRGEVFTVVFGLLARFAPFAGRPAGEDGSARQWRLRPYAVGLLTEGPVHWSLLVFTITILATVTFDGFKETPVWAAALVWITTDLTIRPLLIGLRAMGFDLLMLVETVGLVLLPLTFALAYLGFSAVMSWAGGRHLPVGQVARLFVLSLVPIAIAYHLAHYMSYLLLAGQLIIPLASDPFGFGWNLFGTAAYTIDISVIDAKSVWFLAVGAIVAGHIAAVYLSHVMALRSYPDSRSATRSQYPMMILMVGYTMTSLWILSQPVVE